jgi:hypothetical protein
MRGLIVGLLCLALVACASPPLPATPSPAGILTGTPAPTSTPSATLSADQLALSPPEAVQAALNGQIHMTFVPLTDAQRATVRTAVQDAERIAFATGPEGYGTQGSVFTFTKVGCVFLGFYTGEQMPSYGYVPPTYPAYLVQLLAAPVPGWGALNVEVVVVDAQTGERGPIYGAGAPPGLMGTTCGVTP